VSRRVIAFLSSMLFVVSTISQAEAANTVTALRATPSSNGAQIAWNVQSGSKNLIFEIELTNLAKSNSNPKRFTTKKTNFQLTGLTSWNQYVVRVRAKQGSQYFSWSKKASFVAANVIQGLSASSITHKSATLSWEPALGANFYKISVNGKQSFLTQKNTYDLKNLQMGTSYSFDVTPIKGDLSGSPSESFNFATLNQGPSGLKIVSQSNTRVAISWESIAGAESYEILVDGQSYGNTRNLNYELSKLKPGSKLQISVAARFGSEKTQESGISTIVGAIKPEGLRATQASQDMISVEWLGNSTFNQYKAYLDGQPVGLTSSTNFSFKNLLPGKTYSIQITGIEDGIESIPSELFKANTQITIPLAPVVTVLNAVTAVINWQTNTAATGVTVRLSDNRILSAPAGATSLTVANLSPGSKYNVGIAFRYGDDQSPFSPITEFSTPNTAPTRLSVTGISSTSALFLWDAVPGAEYYEVLREGAAPLTSSATNLLLQSLSPGVSYTVRVRSAFLDSNKIRVFSDWSSLTFSTLSDPNARPINIGTPQIVVVAPTSGVTPVVGATLSTSNGVWSSVPPVSNFTYQWQRSYDGGSTWNDISGALSSQYKLVESDYGFYVRAVVTAFNTNGSATTNSSPSSRIGDVANLQIPVALGTLVVGQTLSATQGSWFSSGILAYSYQWERSSDQNCYPWSFTPIPTFSTSPNYVLTNNEVAKCVRVTVTAQSGLGSLSATSPARGAVPAILNVELPTIVGAATISSELSATTGLWLNSPDTYTFQWEQSSDGIIWSPILGATSQLLKINDDQIGKFVRVQVKGIKEINFVTYSQVAFSLATTRVLGSSISNLSAPVVSGEWTVGFTLSTTAGSWSSSGTYTYKWQNSDDGISWTDIVGANASTYVLTASDGTKFIRSVVTILSTSGSGVAYSAPTSRVGSPYNSSQPTIVITEARVGVKLSSTQGTWKNTPTSILYQWQFSNDGIFWQSISGETTSEFTPNFELANSRIRLLVRAQNGVGESSVLSANIVSGLLPPIATVLPVVTGTYVVSSTLSTSNGTWPSTTSGYTYRWQRSLDGITWIDIFGATESTYTVTTSDLGYRLRSMVSLSTNLGTSVAYSLASPSVTPA
jgi:hypothetical protein